MYKFVLRRLIQAIPTLFGITVISFLLMTQAPGGPTSFLVLDSRMSGSQRNQIAEQLGINDPWYEQYVHWLIGDDWRQRGTDENGEPIMGTRKGMLRGDFGHSFVRGKRPVLELVGDYVIPTLELTTSALIVGLAFGLPIGIFAAIGRGGWFDNVSRIFAVIFNAIPNFWLGLVLILIFGSWLGILPMTGRCPVPSAADMLSGDTGCPPIYARLKYLIMPTFVLGTVYIAGYSRYMRASMLDVINQDYMRTARSKGLSNRSVWIRHGARNALIPIATFLGPAITGLLGGAVLTETIFSWPGLGRASIQAVLEFDYPVVMAIVMIGSVATIIGYIISDILYAVIDPRIRIH